MRRIQNLPVLFKGNKNWNFTSSRGLFVQVSFDKEMAFYYSESELGIILMQPDNFACLQMKDARMRRGGGGGCF